jgi:predicted glycoside hydrolase/deacetylase ChbG (UPF0249 family)
MATRSLLVIADDFGIGPEVSRGILELMSLGSVTGTVLIVNSPNAESAAKRWSLAGQPGEMGWHPNLTMDEPVSPAGQVPSLLTHGRKLAPLSKLLLRMATGRVKYQELVRELDAQYQRYCDLVGTGPALINGHKHIHIFPMVSRALTEVLRRWKVRPYVRRVVEPLACLRRIRGARLKRTFLSTLGTAAAKRQARAGFAGNDYLAGITDPAWVHDPEFYARWLAYIPGNVVEMAVHPGHHDETLLGRDCTATDGQIERRVAEQRLLADPEFLRACRRLGFTLRTAQNLDGGSKEVRRHAA